VTSPGQASVGPLPSPASHARATACARDVAWSFCRQADMLLRTVFSDVFDCTPQHEFLGFSPNGERIRFAEHVFYHFRDGRIAAVWSLIDRPAIEAQLRPGTTK
jgi:SnoaL-like polyketide cyclase